MYQLFVLLGELSDYTTLNFSLTGRSFLRKPTGRRKARTSGDSLLDLLRVKKRNLSDALSGPQFCHLLSGRQRDA